MLLRGRWEEVLAVTKRNTYSVVCMHVGKIDYNNINLFITSYKLKSQQIERVALLSFFGY